MTNHEILKLSIFLFDQISVIIFSFLSLKLYRSVIYIVTLIYIHVIINW